VGPEHIADYLALVGDSADGYPGIAGIGPKGAAALIARYGAIEDFPLDALGERRELALLFKQLATLYSEAALFEQVEDLRWRGPTAHSAQWAERLGTPRLLARAQAAAAQLAQP
jgi:5'-3' exonuclease